MSYYTVFVGGERKDRQTTNEDIENVNRVLSLDNSGGCFTKLKEDGIFIAQIEHVLDYLVSISYIHGEDNLNTVVDMVKATGVTEYSIACHGDNEECLIDLSYEDFLV